MLVLASLQTTLFLLNLHNFGYSASFDNPIFAVGLLYCILFLLLYMTCTESVYVVRNYSIVDLRTICMLY
jgi:hypothetical protein